MSEAIPPATRQDLIMIVVTEHSALQSARAVAIGDANGRTAFFLSTLSAVIVALAFVAQVSAVGQAFVIFAVVLLPMVLVIGLATLERVLQLGIESIRCVVAMNRLRHYYLEIAPELAPHFTLSDRDDAAGVLHSLGSSRSRARPTDLLISNAGLIAMIDAMLGAVAAGLLAWLVGLGSDSAIMLAVVVGALMVMLLLGYLGRSWYQARQAVGVRFPTGAPNGVHLSEQVGNPGTEDVPIR